MSSIVKVDTIQENTSANGITVDGLNIKDSKLVTSNSVVTANITDANVTLAKLAGDSVDATKIADNAISEEHLDVTSITGHTAETSIADGDTILIHDASASALRKMTKANFVSGIGGANTPAFHAYQNGNLSIANTTFQVVTFNTEYFDSNSAYNTSDGKFTVPSGQAGKYLFSFSLKRGNWHSNRFIATFRKNDNDTAYFEDSASGGTNYSSATGSIIMDLAVGDYIAISCYQDSGSAQNIGGSTNQGSDIFSGFKLI